MKITYPSIHGNRLLKNPSTQTINYSIPDNHFASTNNAADETFVLTEDADNNDVRGLYVGSHIFVEDSTYAWLPATVVSSSPTHAIVSIDRPKINTHNPSEFFNPFPDTEKEEGILDLSESSSWKHIPTQNINKTQNMEEFEVEYDESRCVECMSNNLDMANLVNISLPSVLYNMKLMHGKQIPYIRVGKLMIIAINPFTVSCVGFIWFSTMI